jgi:hypothetical protein
VEGRKVGSDERRGEKRREERSNMRGYLYL